MLATWGSSSGINALLASSSLSLNFSNGSYTLGGVPYAVASVPGYSFTRSSGGYAQNVDGSLTWFTGTRTNLNLQSQTLENASWGLTNATVTANAISSPDGTLTADFLKEDTTTGNHSIYQFIPTTATSYAASIYAKAGTRSKMLFGGGGFLGQGLVATFDLANGTMYINTGSKGTITSAGNGWYRCSVIFTTSNTGGFSWNMCDAFGSSTYTGDGVSGLYLWGAQVETTTDTRITYPTSYIPTTTAAVSVDTPRITNKGYLSEEARTNLALQSQALATSPWSTDIAGSTTVVNNAGTAPDNTQTATSLTFTTQFANRTQTINVTAGITYAYSVWLKQISGNTNLSLTILYGAAISVLNPITITNAWAKYTVFFTVPTAITNMTVYVQDRNASNFGTTYAWGAQVETGAFATSYIPTTTAAATRAADALKITGNFMGSGPWTWLTDVASVPNQPGIYPGPGNFYKDVNNYLTIYAPNGAASGNALNLNLKIAGSDVWNIQQSGFTTGTAKIGMALIGSNVYGSVNGSASTSLGTNTLFVPVQISIGYGGSANQVNGYVRGMTVWNSQFSTAQLQAITT